jgi:predicted nucleic acid-binding protein
MFIDTSGWANLYIPSETYHPLSASLFQETRRQKQILFTSNYIIAELIALLDSPFRTPRNQIFTILDSIKSAPFVHLIHITSEIDAAAWHLCKSRPDKRWSLVDCTSFVIMQQLEITTALTTDRHFEQAGFTRLLK